MTSRLFELALADEVRAELARQHGTAAGLAALTGYHPKTLRRKLTGVSPLRAGEVDRIAAALDIEVGVLHDRAHAALDEAKRRHPAGSMIRRTG